MKDKHQKNILVTEFNKHLSGKSEDFLTKLVNFIGDGNKVEVPVNFFDPKSKNSHFRKGLKDEWREACTRDQLKWMREQIHPVAFDFFEWERD